MDNYDYEKHVINPVSEDVGDNKESRFSKLFLIIGLIVIVLFLITMSSYISAYNNLIDMQEDVSLAEANVEARIQRRLELIPDLVTIVKASTEYESSFYEEINEATDTLKEALTSGDSEEINEANSNLSEKINELLYLLKDYPETTTSKEFIALMDSIEGTVNRISIAREEYNEAVSKYNAAIRKFPASIVAEICGFTAFSQFEADEEAEKVNIVDWDNSTTIDNLK